MTIRTRKEPGYTIMCVKASRRDNSEKQEKVCKGLCMIYKKLESVAADAAAAREVGEENEGRQVSAKVLLFYLRKAPVNDGTWIIDIWLNCRLFRISHNFKDKEGCNIFQVIQTSWIYFLTYEI